MWERLIRRLEADLHARQLPGSLEPHDEEAWILAAGLINRRAKTLLRAKFDLNPEEMDEVIQDVLLKLQSLDTMQRVRAAGSPEGYLVVMILNTAKDRLRRRSVERDLLTELGDEHIANEEEKPSGRLSEAAQHLRQVLKSLSDDDRELLHLRFWRNLEIREIAEVLQISYSAAAVRLFRVVKRISTLMEQR